MKRTISILLLACLVQVHAQEKDSLDIMIGQMIMTGIRDYYDPEIKAALVRDLEAGKIGGVVLFEKNLLPENTQAELAKMNVAIQKKVEIPLFITIDEEGGRVNRLKPKYGFHKPPSAQALGEIDNVDSTRFYSEKTAKTLYDLGININFAPNVDVNINPDNPIIGKIGRSFSPDHNEVAQHARAYIEGHNNHNIGTALKHFPGHGSSKNDTHLGIADVSDTWLIEEIFPYQSLVDEGIVRGVMTSHVVNRSLDGSKLPGTLSKKIVQGVLRDHLGYEGVVFTDDMQMKAIADNYGLENAIILAVNAGVDVLIFANNVADYNLVTVERVFDIIKEGVATDKISVETIRKSYKRVMALKKDLGLLEDNYPKKLQKRLKGLY